IVSPSIGGCKLPVTGSRRPARQHRAQPLHKPERPPRLSHLPIRLRQAVPLRTGANAATIAKSPPTCQRCENSAICRIPPFLIFLRARFVPSSLIGWGPTSSGTLSKPYPTIEACQRRGRNSSPNPKIGTELEFNSD